ncbi:MAG: hypothetical protein KatS3mg105_3544 [Gemmatales bacterium]|nr:MAG: hypothetical protein KatS3mg105_3544 [Gemmatales bacterium]
MYRSKHIPGALILGLIGMLATANAQAEEPTKPIKIGLVKTLFRDTSPRMAMVVLKPFSSIMYSMTGVHGELTIGGEAGELAKQLADNEVQLAIFHGVEYAWVQQKYPQLKPLMVAVNWTPHLRAHIVVSAASEFQTFADLQDQIIAMPRGTREHCRMFLDRLCQQQGKTPKQFFDRITKSFCVEDALDDVVDDVVQAAVVDDVAFESYREQKRVRASRLKKIATSEIFPAGVVVYNPAILNDELLAKFRQGMLKARDHVLGKRMLMLWNLTGFEDIPTDYQATLTNIARIYPAPASLAPAKPATNVKLVDQKKPANVIPVPTQTQAEIKVVKDKKPSPTAGKEQDKAIVKPSDDAKITNQNRE